MYKNIAGLYLGEMKDVVSELRKRGDFSGKDDEMLTVVGKEARFILVGLGEVDHLTSDGLRRAAARSVKEAMKFVAESVSYCCLPEVVSKRNHIQFEEMVELVAEGALLGSYQYDKYRSKDLEKKKGLLKEVKIITSDEGFQQKMKTGIETATIIAAGVEMARDLTNAPPNDTHADTLAKEASSMAKKLNLNVIVLRKKEIETHKMHGLLAVNKGSKKEPKFIVLEYNQTKKRLPLYVLVGKGVTFDSGGLSIKPASAMEEMKMDMAGGAAVLGALYVIARMKLPVRIMCLIPATDNMTGGDALCPGDIITYANGKSVEVLNTDAEGRLILADALLYSQRFKPAGVIDLATLTGACVVALASHATGMIGTDKDLKSMLKDAGEKSFERVWELPLYEEYSKMLKSNVADLKNVGGRWGGAITAAAFLKEFVGEIPWVHLDIAGTAILDETTDYAPKGGSGVGVRLLTEFFRRISNSK